ERAGAPSRFNASTVIPSPYQGSNRPAAGTDLSAILRLLRPTDPGPARFSTGSLPLLTAKLSSATAPSPASTTAPPPASATAALGATAMNGGIGADGNGGQAGAGSYGGGSGVAGGIVGRVGAGAANQGATKANANPGRRENEEEQVVTTTTRVVT